MKYAHLRRDLRNGARVVDTRGFYIAAAGPYLSPGLGSVPVRMLEEAINRLVLERCLGPLGLPAWRMPYGFKGRTTNG